MSTNTTIDRSATRLNDLLPVCILTVLAMAEWATWKPQTCLIRTFWPHLGETSSFVLALSLLATSLYFMATSSIIRRSIAHFAFLRLAKPSVIHWSPARRTVVDLLPATGILTLAFFFIILAVPSAIEDLATVTHTVSLVYFLIMTAIFLQMARIPRIKEPILEKGVLTIPRHARYEIYNIAGLLAYVLRETDGRWVRVEENVLVIKGHRAMILDQGRLFPITEEIDMDSTLAEATIDLTLATKRNSFPATVTNEEILKLKTWVSAEAVDRQKLRLTTTGKLSSLLDKQLRSTFGISDQGQFLFENLAMVVKANSLRTWDLPAQVNTTLLIQQVERSLTAALLGRSGPGIPNVYSVELTLTGLGLKRELRDLDDLLTNLATGYGTADIGWRTNQLDKLTGLYANLCPSTDAQRISNAIRNLFTDKPGAKSARPNADNKNKDDMRSGSIAVDSSGELQMPLWDDARVFKAAEDLAAVGHWLAGLRDLKTKLADYRIWSELYYRLREKNLIKRLPPGLRNRALVTAIEQALHIEASQLIDLHSRLYEDIDYRLSIAGRIINEN